MLAGAFGLSALGVLLLAMGGGMLYFSFVWAGDLWESETIWAANELEIPDDRIAFDGEVETTNLIFNDYDLNVEWLHPSGTVYAIDVQMMTFFTGPDSDTPMVVRAMAAEPERATTSWQHDAFWHSVLWILLSFGFSLLMGGAGVAVMVGSVADVRKIAHLSKVGVLRVVPVTDVRATNNNGTVSVTLEVDVDGTTHSLSYVQGSADPAFAGESAVVVLAGDTEVLLPRKDGYPLDLL